MDETTQPLDETQPDSEARSAAEDERPALVAQIEKERARIAQLQDAARQMAADLAALNKRRDADSRDFRVAAFTPILKRILPVLDDIERAMSQIPEPFDKFSWTGNLDYIYYRLQMLLADAGVRPIDALGKPFDPALHEAISFGDDAPPAESGVQYVEVVSEQLLRGYLIEGRLLRSTIVRVERQPAT